ncbi:MAG TPA: proton-conducting transporter membrane subunit [Mycobacteriales bacterium]|nr:proton-conducting transporter membrane subunit [Mycobacteriales bacterium]
MNQPLTMLALALVLAPLAAALLIALGRGPRAADRITRSAAVLIAALGVAFAVVRTVGHQPVSTGGLLATDDAAALFVLVVTLVGAASALLSPGYLDSQQRSFFPAGRARYGYYVTFHCFWAALIAVPLAGNLGMAWLLVEATTGASVLLVAFSGGRRALEAGWKYLVLTTLGLTVALLGILLVLATGPSSALGALDWNTLAHVSSGLPRPAALTAFLLILAGLAAKIGWAPVHHWLPDAHSEAPPPVSALLSAALLPSVMLVAWRVKIALGAGIGRPVAARLFLGFGLLSLAVAVPFLWRALAWKRLLAYSSLEHMGVLALGIGFGTPLAIAGVVVHVLSHALAKSLGFFTAVPLLQAQPDASHEPARGVARNGAGLAGAFGISLGALSGLPPSPLFFSEVFILFAGFLSGHVVAALLGTALLALGFLGLVHALIEGLLGERGDPDAPASAPASVPLGRTLAGVTGTTSALLAGLAAGAVFVPGSALVAALSRWSA